jgi:acetyl esterase/lipase
MLMRVTEPATARPPHPASIHPAFAEHLHLLEGLPSFPESNGDPAVFRRLDEFQRATTFGEPPTVAARADAAPGPHGPVPVRVYEPEGPNDGRPCLVWMHGGAFVGGDLDMPEADWVARDVVTRAGAVVVSVDYRLAVGGVTYPVPHDDVVAAVRWIRDNAGTLGVDAGRITVGGASAGGNLAAGATLRVRDEDGWLPAHLLLAYATVHAVVPPPSASLAALMTEVPRILRFLPSDRAAITANYLGGPDSRADGYAMPGIAVLDGLCPTVLLNAEYDDLRPSAEAFAASLAVAGVDVRQVLARGMLHGFLNHACEIEPVGQALDLVADVVAGPSRSVSAR